jgi:hypothetical protein
MSNPLTEREPLRVLKTYPAFQALRAQAEMHEWEYRPKEAAKLQKSGTLGQVLDSRAVAAWNAIRDCLANGMNPNEAEEVGLPNILLPTEADEAAREDDDQQ